MNNLVIPRAIKSIVRAALTEHSPAFTFELSHTTRALFAFTSDLFLFGFNHFLFYFSRHMNINLVAQGGFAPPTSWLWARRAATALPRDKKNHVYKT